MAIAAPKDPRSHPSCPSTPCGIKDAECRKRASNKKLARLEARKAARFFNPRLIAFTRDIVNRMSGQCRLSEPEAEARR
ncbi:hypothetical protein [Porphyrobacter sp. SLTP]|uniref:hypothetical protein n=1 Tax=Porphyrobacter sp. SLTP TaxID=2683266 RepID=UPI002570BA44|nr:hypothetical protein [Porphyrobacter sp. SLTP]